MKHYELIVCYRKVWSGMIYRQSSCSVAPPPTLLHFNTDKFSDQMFMNTSWTPINIVFAGSWW